MRTDSAIDYEDLVSRLRSGSSQSRQSSFYQQQPQHQSVSSPTYSPQPGGLPQFHPSANMSPGLHTSGAENVPPMASSNPQKSLLDLLRNSGSPSHTSAPNELPAASPVGPPPAQINPNYQASHSGASFAAKPPSHIPPHSRGDGFATSSGQGSPHPQDFLLKLLNNPKPAQHDNTSTQSPRGSPMETSRTGNNPGQFTSRNPFDQLAASSPRNQSPKPGDRSTGPTPKMEILKHGGQKSKLSSEPSPRTTLTQDGYKAPTPGYAETVSEAVTEVGNQVEKEVEQALAFGDATFSHEEMKQAEKEVKDMASEIKEELADEATRQALEETAPKGFVETLDQVVDDIENADIADNWEDTSEQDGVREYKLPLKPFVSIELTGKDGPSPFDPKIISHIAKLKKDFDQIDRTLATATNNYIIYGGSKHGGFRLICQKSGANKQLFQSSNERIFNVSLCRVSPLRQNPTVAESVIATGINGSVYWVELPQSDKSGGAIEGQDLEAQGFVFPPEPAHDNNTSGSQLRTRAKKSSRHPEYFAIGRGRSIHLIFPDVARDEYCTRSNRVCDSARYLKERCLKIDTGKAGKDFAFSEDDTVIVSLDKAGRMRFWDIREMTDADWKRGEKVEIVSKVPLLTFYTTSPSDKSWPTSVMFIDKDRPTYKGYAMRYLVVGMKQNHTLQLWDLGLEKPVQEISFPHENESDGICSVAYIAKSTCGYLIVGHSTRNSIYVITVSAPKYTLPPMTQATALERLVGTGQPLPKPESTAIMGSVREFSFKGQGELRSVDILNDSTTAEHYPDGEAPLLELYVMHSKGVTCFGLSKDDITTDKASVISAKDAEVDGHILVKEIKVVNQVEHQPSEPSTNGDQVERPPPSKVSARESRKETGSVRTTQSQLAQSTLARVENQQDQARAAILNGGAEKSEKEKPEKEKKKKKKGAAPTVPADAATVTSQSQPSVAPQTSQRSTSPPPPSKEISPPTTAPFNMNTLTTEVERLFKDSLGDLRITINDDRRAQDAAAHGRQEALLRVVSRTLTENVEASLKHIVAEQIQRTMMPRIDEAIGQTLGLTLNSVLPKAVNEAMQEPDIVRNVSELVVQKVAMQLNNSNHSVLSQVTETERRLNAQLQAAEMKRQADAEKIEELTNVVTNLAQSLQNMTASQENFQRLLMEQRDRSPPPRQLQHVRASPEPTALPEPRQVQHDRRLSQNDPMMQIVEYMRNGNFEEAAVMWLQSRRENEYFDRYFASVDTKMLEYLSPLVTLSIIAAVGGTFHPNLVQRVNWIEAGMNTLTANPPDSQLHDVIPRIMDLTLERVKTVYEQLMGSRHREDPIFKQLSSIAERCHQLKLVAQSHG